MLNETCPSMSSRCSSLENNASGGDLRGQVGVNAVSVVGEGSHSMNKENAGEGEQVGAIGRVFCTHVGRKSVGGLMRR